MRSIRFTWPVLLLILLVPACGWTRLACQAWHYPVTARGDAVNVAVAGGRAYAALGEDGFAVVVPWTGETLERIAPPAGMDGVHDVACEGRLLFVLDATPPGQLAAFDVSDPEAPRLVIDPVAVPVGPFSGVAAAGGRVIVSGGTSELTVFAHDGATGLRPTSHLDLGRGQPDVAIAPDGRSALVSTHFRGPRFGATRLVLDDDGLARARGDVELDGAGFSAGGAHPANFPITAAPAGDAWIVASGGGLVLLRPQGDALAVAGRATLDLSPVHVAADGDTVVVVGSEPAPALVELRLERDRFVSLRTVALPEDARPTAVVLTPDLVLVAAGRAGVIPVARRAAPRSTALESEG